MSDSRINLSTITGRVNAKAFELLDRHPEGISWTNLLSEIKKSDNSFHPKTVNGCIWKLVDKFPDKIYKPAKGLFRLVKYKTKEVESLIKARTVEEYVDNIPANARPMFYQLRDLVKKQLPNSEEVFSYGIVGYKIDDKRARVFISGWKDHVAMYPIPKNELLKSKLKPYIKGKGTLWFPLDKPLPLDIIKKSIEELSRPQ